MKAVLHEALGYAVVSGCALLADMALLALLVQVGGWHYLAAATTSFVAGACIAYSLSVRFVFSEHKLHNRRTEFLGFIALGGIGIAVNAAVIYAAVAWFGLHYLIAKCVAAGCSFGCNFVARRQLLFVQRTV